MTREQEHAVRQQARQAANHDDDLGRARTKERAAWWVGELSYKLGIVDSKGMIDVHGEVARAFTRAYLKAPHEVWPTQDTTGTSPQRLKENEMATRRRQSAPKGRDPDRLFAGVYPTGIVYADKSREAHGDYARCAFLDFATLTLQFERDCPSDLRAEITRDAAKIQARRGEQFAISASGHTVTLGGGRRTSENMNMANKPRKPIQDMIAELRSWLPNYDHGPLDYPTLVWRILASAPGGDEAEGMGYEPFNIGWHEIAQLGEMLEAIQDKQDVEDLVAGLMSEEDPDEVDEAPRRGVRPASRRPVRRGR